MDENNQIIIYQSKDGGTRIEVKFTGERFGYRSSRWRVNTLFHRYKRYRHRKKDYD